MNDAMYPEIEERTGEVIFHHLLDANTGDVIRVACEGERDDATKKSGLRDVRGYSAWELGQVAASMSERLFAPEKREGKPIEDEYK